MARRKERSGQIVRLHPAHSRVRPVVGDLGGPGTVAEFHKVEAQPFPRRPDDVGSIHPLPGQGAGDALAQGVGGQPGEPGHFHPQAGQADGGVGFGAAHFQLKMGGLIDALYTGRGEAQHCFAKGENVVSSHQEPRALCTV